MFDFWSRTYGTSLDFFKKVKVFCVKIQIKEIYVENIETINSLQNFKSTS